MKSLKTNKKNISWGKKDNNGIILTSKEEIQERWASFYEDLYADSNTCDPIPVPDDETKIPNTTIDEIYSHVNKMKKDKNLC